MTNKPHHPAAQISKMPKSYISFSSKKLPENEPTTGKVNTIDNQLLTYQNIGNNRQQTGKTCKAVNLFQDNK